MTPTVVSIIIAVVFVLIVAWDIYLAVDDIRRNTISARLRRIPAGLRLLIPFGCGLVIGHLWW